jgi:hypothetical protein
MKKMLLLGLALVWAGSVWAEGWPTIVTKKGREIRRPALAEVTDAGAWVVDGTTKERVYVDGRDMPDWLVAELKEKVQEERRKKEERIAAAARGEYQRKNDEKKLPWGDGKGTLRVGPKTLTVTSLMEETPVGIKVLHSGGVAWVGFEEMDAETRAAFGYEPALAAKWASLSAAEKAREQAAWFERRKAKEAKAAKE